MRNSCRHRNKCNHISCHMQRLEAYPKNGVGLEKMSTKNWYTYRFLEATQCWKAVVRLRMNLKCPERLSAKQID